MLLKNSKDQTSSGTTPSLWQDYIHELTRKLRRSRDLVRRTVALGVTLRVVDANQNTRIVGRIRTREANSRSCARARARNIDLCTAHIELRASLVAGTVKRNDLRTEKVLPWRDTGGECEVDPATSADLNFGLVGLYGRLRVVSYHSVNTPCS